MASSAAHARSTGLRPLQIAGASRLRGVREVVERWLEAERDQLPLWLPVMLGAGVSAWFLLPGPSRWGGFILGAAAVSLAAAASWRGGRLGRAIAVGMLAMAIGCALIWWRAEHVAEPVLAHEGVAEFTARVESVEPLPARDLVRLRLTVEDTGKLPPVVRVNLAEKDVPEGLGEGAVIHLRGWMMPPPPPAVPGAYDFQRVAWFQGLGATGRGFKPIEVLKRGAPTDSGFRHRLSNHVRERVAGSAGAIAATLATGDRGAIPDEDAEAMRRSGLAHLLSISGLHVTAVVGATMLIVLRLLALFPGLALRVRLPLVAAGAGAVAAVGYTLLTGAQVPTVRSCVAALLVLAAIAMGREAITLRLVATGALIVLLLWPETLAGPSFQLSFAAVTAIIALHEHPRIRDWFARRDEAWWRRVGRALLSLFLTGLVVELALMPIALYHFHKAGLYGALANIVAIPLTTFVIMPFEALGLVFDLVGLGAPFWWVTGSALRGLLALAHMTASAPGAVAALPVMPGGAFAAIIGGGLWVALWRTRARWFGAVPIALGLGWALSTPPPDLLVSTDGTHMAIRMPDGGMAILRNRSGDYIRDTFGENGGIDGELANIDEQRFAKCSHDACIVTHAGESRSWRILATRSEYLIARETLEPACRDADIVVSDRWLPAWCNPRWLKLDARTLANTGGVTVTFTNATVRTARSPASLHPWHDPPTVSLYRKRRAAAGQRQ